jgi:hypothetical protein
VQDYVMPHVEPGVAKQFKQFWETKLAPWEFLKVRGVSVSPECHSDRTLLFDDFVVCQG